MSGFCPWYYYFMNCKKCKIDKPENRFQKLSNGSYRSKCKDCRNEEGRSIYAENIDKYRQESRALALKKSYWKKLTPNQALQEYDKLLKAQDHRCAICRTHQSELTKPLCVDHNHLTEKVRGLLCLKCNVGIGFLKSDTGNETLLKAISYLKE